MFLLLNIFRSRSLDVCFSLCSFYRRKSLEQWHILFLSLASFHFFLKLWWLYFPRLEHFCTKRKLIPPFFFLSSKIIKLVEHSSLSFRAYYSVSSFFHAALCLSLACSLSLSLFLAFVTNSKEKGLKCTGSSLSQKLELLAFFAKQRNQLHNYLIVRCDSFDWFCWANNYASVWVCMCVCMGGGRQLVCFVGFVRCLFEIFSLFIASLFCFIQVFPLGMNRKSIDFKKNKNFCFV